MTRINIGQQFKRWTVVEQVENHPKFRYRQFRCRCECGTERVVNVHRLLDGTSGSCGCLMLDRNKERVGAKHPCWKGGRYKDAARGYAYTRDPRKPATSPYRLEHQIVMEQHLGRELLPGENVHHKNGVRDDNRIENLELWVTMQPSGQRPEDLLAFAHEIIRRYE